MNPVTIIALTSLLISVLMFISTEFTRRRTASSTYVDQLEKRVASLEKELETAKQHIHELESANATQLKENIALLRELARLGDNGES